MGLYSAVQQHYKDQFSLYRNLFLQDIFKQTAGVILLLLTSMPSLLLAQNIQNFNQSLWFEVLADGQSISTIQSGSGSNRIPTGRIIKVCRGVELEVIVRGSTATSTGNFVGMAFVMNKEDYCDGDCHGYSQPTLNPDYPAGASGLNTQFTNAAHPNPNAPWCDRVPSISFTFTPMQSDSFTVDWESIINTYYHTNPNSFHCNNLSWPQLLTYNFFGSLYICLLYTSDAADDLTRVVFGC